jgi:hypothetical protein
MSAAVAVADYPQPCHGAVGSSTSPGGIGAFSKVICITVMMLSVSTPAQRGRIGAHVSWSRTIDRAARTEPGRKGFLARFEREVDPDGVLPEGERARRAEHARRAYMQKLALASAASRRQARAAAR